MRSFTTRHPRLYKLSFVFLLLGVMAATIAIAFIVQAKLTEKTDHDFDQDVTKINQNLVADLQNYNAILYSGRALITSSQQVTQQEWNNFFDTQSIDSRYPGVSAVFYIDVIPANTKRAFEQTLRSDPYFGPNFSIKSTSVNPAEYAVARLVYSKNDVSGSLGFDNYSTASRRVTYDAAAANNQPTASQPLKLSTGSLGFFITLPVYSADKQVDGFVAVSFRATDFIRALLGDTNKTIAVKVADVTDSKQSIELYESSNWNGTSSGIVQTRTVKIAERTWQVTYKSQRSYDYPLLSRGIPRLILAIGGLIIIVLILAHKTHDRGKQIKNLRK